MQRCIHYADHGKKHLTEQTSQDHDQYIPVACDLFLVCAVNVLLEVQDNLQPFICSNVSSSCCFAGYFPPRAFYQQPHSGTPEVQGNTKVLLCAVEAHPPAVYRWRKDGRFIQEANQTDTSFKIKNIGRSDAGEYQCVASNEYGSAFSNKVNILVACKYPFFIFYFPYA